MNAQHSPGNVEIEILWMESSGSTKVFIDVNVDGN